MRENLVLLPAHDGVPLHRVGRRPPLLSAARVG
jgi:hypothetical protein